ncbi:MAG: hypothetical protein ACK5XV_08595 [Flavobacteriales bacterium]
MRTTTLFSLGAVACLMAVLLPSCEERTGTHQEAPALDSNEVSTSGTLSLEGEIISVPSPTQMAILLEKAKIPFDAALLNPLQNKSVYVSELRKAMALGVYGADLSYAGIYESGQLNSDYLNVIGELASALQIIDHVDPKLFRSLNNSVGNRDSLLQLSATFYRAGDSYLEESRRPDLAALMLLGGWSEALYISIKAGKGNADVRARVGEQKDAAASIERLVAKISDPSLKPVQNQLATLAEAFSGLRSVYTYQKPINDNKQKITYLRGKTTVEVTDQQLASLDEAVTNLRNLIIR